MKINDFVTRISHSNDILFQIVQIQKDKVLLKGISHRLIADAPMEDLVLSPRQPIEFQLPYIFSPINVAPGKILHIDGDQAFVEKAKEAYIKYRIPATCYYIDESQMPGAIPSLLSKDKYDVLVITGHDYYKDKKQTNDNLTSYQNSINFVGAVQQARRIYPDLDSLAIVAGACQSDYESLIQNGANFASSPHRENIHLLDPIIVASIIATSSVKEYVSPEEVIEKTISKAMGGIETKGKARVHYAGVSKNGYYN